MAQVSQLSAELSKGLLQLARALLVAVRNWTLYPPEHPTVATLTSNLGQILKAQGDVAGARRYTERALAVDEKVYGLEHPNVALLRLLGLDDNKLTYFHAGRFKQLSQVGGSVIKELLA